MAEPARERKEIRDFPGMITSADPDDIPDGAAEVQVNLISVKPGEMRVRSGYKFVSFEE